MRHKYLRHKCLRIWGEIAKLNVAELRAIKLNRKNKCRKIFKNMAKRKLLCHKIQCTYAETASKFKYLYIWNFKFIKKLSYRYFLKQ